MRRNLNALRIPQSSQYAAFMPDYPFEHTERFRIFIFVGCFDYKNQQTVIRKLSL